jgi:hypothetical protein
MANINTKIAIKIIKEIIILLEKNGIEIDSPYDLENFAQDYLCDHSLIIKTGKFEYRDYED